MEEEKTYHPLPVTDDQVGLRRSIRDDPPTHYTFKIQSFSLLSKNSIERYDSGVFDAGGYKWKLSLYPKGDKTKYGKDHISLYLVMAETASLPPGWEVNVVFRFFLFDHMRDKYLMLEDMGGRSKRFHGVKTEWGFAQLIPFSTFNDPSKGYLVDDSCVFGAEVFICKERNTGKGECLSMVKGAITQKHVWKIEKFSKLKENYRLSEVFTAGDHKWKLKQCPMGSVGKYNGLSLYLLWADSATLTAGRKVYTDFRLRIRDQLLGNHIERQCKTWFSASSPGWGWLMFMKLNDLKDPHNNYFVKDTCIVEAEVTVLGLVNKLP